MTTPHKETILVTQSAKNEKPSYLQFLETKVKPNDSQAWWSIMEARKVIEMRNKSSIQIQKDKWILTPTTYRKLYVNAIGDELINV